MVPVFLRVFLNVDNKPLYSLCFVYLPCLDLFFCLLISE